MPGWSVFRRRIIADARTNGIVRAGVEDDFHHYELLVRHADGLVLSVDAKSFRTPWTTCKQASRQLSQLVGEPISKRLTDRHDAHQHCTHMFELAEIAFGQAARGGRRRYDIAVPHREIGGAAHATLCRDGGLVLDWDLQGDVIVAPTPFAGRNLRSMLSWASEAFEGDAFEAVKVFRRGIHVSAGRSVNFGESIVATDLKRLAGACYVFQPNRVGEAVRSRGTQQDFTHRPQALLTGFET